MGKLRGACKRDHDLDPNRTVVALMRRGAEALRVPIPARDRLLRECWAMAEQPRALDQNRIGEGPLTRLSADEMTALELALRAALGLAGGTRLESWRAALERGNPFLDLVTGSLVLVMHREERPWIVILSKDGDRVVTTYPSDERTETNRRGAGR